MRISKLKWKWIKFWGHSYLITFPDKFNKQIVLYHRRWFDVKQWDNFFKEAKNDSLERKNKEKRKCNKCCY